MRDKKVIALGLCAFLALVTLPIWYGFAVGGSAAPPALRLPPSASKCVESKEWMIANHPKLLSEWRNSVVRQGMTRQYTSKTYGTKCEMSLTKTCIQCHGSAQEFCDKCHSYVNVSLNCWGCHLNSTGQKP
jgi:hypothetical protein